MAKDKETTLVRAGVYMEPALKKTAERLAKRQRRSLSALICVLLEKAIAEAEARGEIEASLPVSVRASHGGAGDQ